MKDIWVECIGKGRSGTATSSNDQTIYDILPAGQTKKFTHINIGFIHPQVASESVAIKTCAWVR